MNQLEVLLEQAKKEAKKIGQESYSEGFRDAEGTADIMQRSFNEIQNLLLAALGRKHKLLETTEETATEVVEKLKTLQDENADLKRRVENLSDPKVARWIVDYSPENNPLVGWANLALFGDNTNTPKSLVFSEDINTLCTAEVEVLRQKIDRLVRYFEKRAKENTKRAKELEAKSHSFLRLDEIVQEDRSSYYLSGKADSYERAAQKVREILG